MTNSRCRSKVPAFCRIHGEPHPLISVVQVRAEIRKMQKQEQAAALSGGISNLLAFRTKKVALERRLLALTPIRQHRRLKVSLPENDRYIGQAEMQAQVQKEIASYKKNVFKNILGENSVEYKAYATDVRTSLASNRVGFTKFTYMLSDDLTSGVEPEFYANSDQRTERGEAIQKARDYVAKGKADGFVEYQTGIYTVEYIPYRLKHDQLTVEKKAEILARPHVQQAIKSVDKAIELIRHGKTRSISE